MTDHRDKFKRHTPPTGVRSQIAGEFQTEEVTGQITDPDALAEARSRRPTRDRIARLEVSRDKISQDLSDLKVGVGEMKGEMKVWPELVAQLKHMASSSTAAANAHAEADKLSATADLELAKARAMADLELAKARASAELEQGKQKAAADAAVAADKLEANKATRKRWEEWHTKAVAGAGIAAAAIMAMLQARSC